MGPQLTSSSNAQSKRKKTNLRNIAPLWDKRRLLLSQPHSPT